MITNPESALLIDLNFEDDTSQAKSPPKKKTRSRQSSPSSSESSTPEQGHTTASKTAKEVPKKIGTLCVSINGP